MTGLLILLLWSVAALCVVCVLLHRRWKRCEAELFKSHADLNWCMDERRLATSERDNLRDEVSKLRGRHATPDYR